MSGTTTFVSIAAVVQMRKKNQEGAFLGGLLEVRYRFVQQLALTTIAGMVITPRLQRWDPLYLALPLHPCSTN
jgi:hypothetical protein